MSVEQDNNFSVSPGISTHTLQTNFMRRYIQYWLSVSRVRKVRKKYLAELDKINNEPWSNETNMEGALINENVEQASAWIEYLQTKYYSDTCKYMVLPVPKENDIDMYYNYNFDDNEGDRYIFTTAGFSHIRKQIRTEKKERREEYGYWIALFIGIIGALTGFISIIIKC